MEDKNQEIIESAKKLPAPDGKFSLAPRNFDEAYRFANFIASSDLVPKDFRDKPANVLIAVQLAMELGLSPMQGLQSIYVVNGRPALYGDALPALVLASGLLESIEETGDDKNASCTVKRKGLPAITRTFSMAEAAKVPYAEWIDNKKVMTTLDKKSTYQAYGKRMLAMRARAFAFRDAFADVLKGVSIKEEIEDALDVTPQAEPLKTPKPLEVKADDKSPTSEPARANDAGDAPKAPSHVRGNGPGGATGERSDSNDQLQDTDAADRKLDPEEVAKLAIDSYEKDTWPKATILAPLIKSLDQQAANRVCAYFNARKKEVCGA